MNPRKNFRALRVALIALALGYSGCCILIFLFQRKLLFIPPVRESQFVERLARESNLERWTNSAGENIGMKKMCPAQPAAAPVLVCYGNGGSATGCAHYAEALQSVAALNVFILEYPGYEDRPGNPARESLLHAADEAFLQLGTDRPVFIVGESLGTGVAAWLAGKFPGRISGLIFLSPYERLADVAQYQYPWLPARWLMRDDFWSGNFLQRFHGMLGVMVDGRDQVVPERFGQRLFDEFDGTKKLWRFADCGHIQIGAPEQKFWREVIEFWKLPER